MTAQERLIRYYQNSYARLIRKISSLPPGADWGRYYKRLLSEIEAAVSEMDKAAAEELAELVKTTYTDAEAKALADIPAGPAAPLNRRAMQLIAENAVDNLTNANNYFGRHMSDRIREIGLDAVAEKISSAQTVRQAKHRIVEMLQSDGMTTVVGGSGRRYRLESYAELVARTTTREATNTATTSTAEQMGYDLVKFTMHYPTCDVCAPIQGRVFSVSGKDPRFPALSSIPGFDNGFRVLHPNCRHVLSVVVEDMLTDDEREKYLADGDKPVRGDTRSAQEVDRYNAAQAEKRDRWQDRRQWEKYKALLGDDAPTTFSGFRATKRADNDRWRLMQVDYKRRIRLTNNPELALPNAAQSSIADAKFTGYLYNPDRQEGYTKGLAFSSHLGYNIDNWKDFRAELLQRSRVYPAKQTKQTEFGIKFEQKMVVYGPKRNPMDVLVVWIVKDDTTLLVTAYPD